MIGLAHSIPPRFGARSRLCDTILPTAVADLKGLYVADASSIVLTVGVSQWSDTSGAGNHLTQPTGAMQPTWSATGWAGSKGGVLFDGTNDLLHSTSAGLLTAFTGSDAPHTVLWGSEIVTNVTAKTHWSANSTTPANNQNTRLRRGASTVYQAARRDDASTILDVNGTLTVDTLRRRHVLQHTGTAVSHWVDGAADINAGAQNVGVLTLQRFTVGGLMQGATPSERMNIRFRYLVVYARALTATELAGLDCWAQGVA